MKRTRRVFGRIRKGGYTFELTPYGVYVKKKYSRVAWKASFSDLVFAATGQKVAEFGLFDTDNPALL